MQELSKPFSFKELFTHVKPTKQITKLLSLGFGIILISWLLSQIDISSASDIIRGVPVPLLIIGFFCYVAGFYLRAQRFRLLLPPDKSIKHLFPIVLVHYTALNIIPARLGEFSYVYLLKQVNNISTGCSLSSLIMARVFDQIVISLLFLISSFFVDFSSQWLKTLKFCVGGFLIAIFVMLMFILAYKERCVQLLEKGLIRLKLHSYKITQRVMQILKETVMAFKNIEVKGNAIKILLLSGLIWMSIFTLNFCLLLAFEVKLSYIEVVLASSFIISLSVIPFQALSGLGIHEATWTFVAVALGVPKNIAIVSAFGTHILSTIYLFLFGLYGLWKMSIIKHVTNMRNTHP